MARPSDFWRNLLRELMAEHGVSMRRLGRITGINRKAIARFLHGHGSLPMDRLETVLAVFDYVLGVVPRKERP
ncbi:helix-turn-helix transcriptional regulator [Shinella daejeonensis]|uniref:helix-turn-helix domain-containing protein n=1 Tax=Shinella daejeonensis TaxID=659017 RepID=UPI0020C7EF53|nr:helix-turn-helix transcriptional regulator [Shinella daejeonensis]MCP8894332.1 helix-turn-helix transcriptional regulator [Shinella daejeonensis]